MDDYKTANVEKRRKIYCNSCGEEISKAAFRDTYMDYLHINKSWGYFSSKDLTAHTFNICEKCYNNWVTSFCIPIEEIYVEDGFFYTEEEIKLLNEAYKAELCKQEEIKKCLR